MSRNKGLVTTVVLAAVIVLFVAAFIVIHLRNQRDTAALDAGLKRTATRLLPVLSSRGIDYSQDVTFFRTYEHWVFSTRDVLKARAAQLIPRSQFVQVQLVEQRTEPPQSQLALSPHHAAVPVDNASLQRALTSGKSTFIDTSQGSIGLRAYLTPVPLPPALQGENASAVLVVFQPQ